MLRAVVPGISGYGDEVQGPSGSTLKVEAGESELTLSGATTTASDLVPDGAMVIGVTTRVTEAITGASGYQVGDGSDADRWGDVDLTSLGSITHNANATNNLIQLFLADNDIVITAKTSNFTGGKLRVVAFWFEIGAPTE